MCCYIKRDLETSVFYIITYTNAKVRLTLFGLIFCSYTRKEIMSADEVLLCAVVMELFQNQKRI